MLCLTWYSSKAL